ncbi:hypothetical protein INT45_008120 [Circinella minor]|uniref:MULE transposase domain-containing protein n=1 Tax=Circinella minor TaxID=1195481 RepID=A0A8H7RQN7_9FUNG|nr:hypothetical protein INT45_008120 [Circinella minor]
MSFFTIFKLVFHLTIESALFFGKFDSNAIAKPKVKRKRFSPIDDKNDEDDEDEMKRRPIQKNDKDNVEFVYLNDHNDHIPGSIGDVQYLHKSKELNEQILEELHKGYYLEAFQNSQYHIWIDVTDVGESSSERLISKDFAFGFVAPWQLAYFKDARFVSLDAMHDVSKYKDGVLYTMVICDPIAGRGVPINYLLINDLSSKPLLGWFHSLAAIGLNPQRFTIDNSLPEDNTIAHVWPNCSIQHCIWHVMRAWMQNVQAKVHGSIE